MADTTVTHYVVSVHYTRNYHPTYMAPVATEGEAIAAARRYAKMPTVRPGGVMITHEIIQRTNISF